MAEELLQTFDSKQIPRCTGWLGLTLTLTCLVGLRREKTGILGGVMGGHGRSWGSKGRPGGSGGVLGALGGLTMSVAILAQAILAQAGHFGPSTEAPPE